MDPFFDAAPCGLMQTADDGMVLRVNRTFATWIGRTPEEVVQQLRLQDLLTMGGRIFMQTHWTPLLRMQGSVSEVKLEILHLDGTKIPMVLNAVRREIEGKVRVDLAAFVARDRDRYEQELIKSRKRLEDLVAETRRLHAESADRALFAEQMIGIVSHDLRNPLGTVTMGVTLLAETVPPDQQRIVASIQRATDRAAKMIADLLDFTRARTGHVMPTQLESFDLHRVVGDAVEDLHVAHPARSIDHARIGEGKCTADPERVSQVVGNLVGNALAYGQPGTPITVTSAIGTPCSVSVHNFGVAIPQDRMAAIFEPMTRGTSIGAKTRSVGLGLFIVREIARAHGGEATVTSGDSGTTFTVTFGR